MINEKKDFIQTEIIKENPILCCTLAKREKDACRGVDHLIVVDLVGE